MVISNILYSNTIFVCKLSSKYHLTLFASEQTITIYYLFNSIIDMDLLYSFFIIELNFYLKNVLKSESNTLHYQVKRFQ